MNISTDLELSNNFNSLSEEDIRQLIKHNPEDKKQLIVDNVLESNSHLLKEINNNKIKIEGMKKINRILLKATWNNVESKKEAAQFFKELSKNFE